MGGGDKNGIIAKFSQIVSFCTFSELTLFSLGNPGKLYYQEHLFSSVITI